jgi:hypothetical protein
MGEAEWLFGPLGTRDDYPDPLCLLDDGEELVNVDLARRSLKVNAEATTDHCGGGSTPSFHIELPLFGLSWLR